MRLRFDWWTPWHSAIARALTQIRLVALLGVACVLLSGCVDYQVSLRFDSPNRGELVQRIHLESIGSAVAQDWLSQLETRAADVQGRIQRLSKQDLQITIPFSQAKDLEQKFNQFFSALGDRATASGIPEIVSNLKIHQSNWLLFEHDRITYDIDLSALGVQLSSGESLLNPGQLFDLQFGITAPWGVGNPSKTPPVDRTATSAHWVLQPGNLNHIEAVIWMVLPLGWGALAIALLVAGGLYYRSKRAS